MEFDMNDPIDRTGFDEIHIYDWPIVLYNGLRQTLDMREDDPRRQDYCAWCRGFGSQRVFLPDLCPGCRGTCLVSVRQQYFLMDRMYYRLDDVIYPDWPIWAERKNPILGSKSGQWNNADPVMSARARIVEIRFDEERRAKNPVHESRIQYPSPEVEEVFKQMKFSRRYFPPKPDTPIRISCKFFPRILPDYKPSRLFVRTSEEIKKIGLQPYRTTPKPYDCYSPHGPCEKKSYSLDKTSEEAYFGQENPETDAKNLHPSENDPKNSQSSENDTKNLFSSSENMSNVDPSENGTKVWFLPEKEPRHLQYELLDQYKNLKHQENQLQATLKVLREERYLLASTLVDAKLPRKELLNAEESLMKFQQQIVSIQHELNDVISTLSDVALPASSYVPEVAQFSGETIVSPREMSAPEIRFTQIRSWVVRPSNDGCDWDVSGRAVKLAGDRYLDGKIDGFLTADDILVGMTLGSDDAMFNSMKIRSDSRIKFVLKKDD